MGLSHRASAACRAAILSALILPTVVASGQTDDPVWPMADGSTDIMSGFQNPMTARYFHEGIDICGNRNTVVAIRSGRVIHRNRKFAGGTLIIDVPTDAGPETDLYAHAILGPWQVGDLIEAGDVIGIVSDQYFLGTQKHHLHVNRGHAFFGFSGFIKFFRDTLPPLELFAREKYRDPQVLPAQTQDASENGWEFGIVQWDANNQRIPAAFGSVDLLVEATDRQSSTLYYHQVITSIAYWIESQAGGDDVRGPDAPYRLMRFNEPWRRSHADPDSLFAAITMTKTRFGVAWGNTNTGFQTVATYRVTNTSGTTGLASDIAAGQFWRSDARVGTGVEPNGYDALIAEEIHEARFPDGLHTVHALVEDLRGETETTYTAIVDNYRPYVEAVRVHRLDLQRLLYDARWHFDNVNRVVRYESTAAPGSIARSKPDVAVGDGILIEVEFSEPMKRAHLLSIEPAIGFLPTLRVDKENPRRWTARIPRSRLGAVRDQTLHQLEFSGIDLAGTTLYPLDDTSERSVPIGKRTTPAPIRTATRDTVHRVPFRAIRDGDPEVSARRKPRR